LEYQLEYLNKAPLAPRLITDNEDFMNLQEKKANDLADELVAEMLQRQSIPNQDAEHGNTEPQQAAPVQPGLDTDLAPTPEPEYQANSELEKLQQSYKVLEGKYRREVPELHRMIRDQRQKYEQTISDLKKQLTEQKSSVNYFKGVSEEFGDKTAQIIQSGVVELLDDRIPAQTQTQDEGVELQNQKKLEFIAHLVGGKETLDRIDDDPGFNAWLDKFDTNTGTQRRQLLFDHFHAGRLNETADMYITWSSEQQQHAKPQPEQSTQQQILEEQVQPGSVKNTQPQQNLKRTYTMAEYRALSDDIVKNKYYRVTEEGRAKAAAIQGELDAAFNEGRVLENVPEGVKDPFKFSHDTRQGQSQGQMLR